MTTESPATVRDVAFVFDSGGLRCAGTHEADSILGMGHVATLGDLNAHFRQPDGMDLDFGSSGTRPAVGIDGAAGRRVSITTELVDADSERPTGVPAVVVVIHAFPDEDDPRTLHQALGSVLAHELRTPMTTIYGGAQLVASDSVSAATRTEAARSVAREAQHLHRVIEDLVVLVRSSAEEAPDLEPVLLQHIVDAVIAAHPDARAAGVIDLAVPAELPAVLAAQDDVEQVLRNLIALALSATPPDGTVRIEGRRAGDTVEIHVIDAGAPRDGRDAGRTFDLFHRTPGRDHDASGANISHVVSRRLVERMAGRIWAVDRPAGGEIAFALPIARGTPTR